MLQGTKNESWKTIASIVFQKLKDDNPSIQIWKQKDEKIRVHMFLWPFSRCLEITDIKSDLAIGLTDNVEFFIIDPSLFTPHRMNKLSMTGDKFTLQSRNSTKYGVNKIFYVTTTVINKRPEKETCTVYDTVDGYSNCIEKSYVKKFMELLGCLPPWYTVSLPEHLSIQNCTYPIRFTNQIESTYVRSLIEDVTYAYLFMKNVKIEEEFCRQPCKKLMYNVELMEEKHAAYDVNWIEFKFADIVAVKNEISNYDALRLIVEVCI